MSIDYVFCHECGEEVDWHYSDDYDELEIVVRVCGCQDGNLARTRLHKSHNMLAAKIKRLEKQLSNIRNDNYELHQKVEFYRKSERMQENPDV